MQSTNSNDDPTLKFDWWMYPIKERTVTAPGCLIQPWNPENSSPKSLKDPVFYLLDSHTLVALAASMFESLGTVDLKSIPKIDISDEFPYWEWLGIFFSLLISLFLNLGKACFLCESSLHPAHVKDLPTVLIPWNVLSAPCHLYPSTWATVSISSNILVHIFFLMKRLFVLRNLVVYVCDLQYYVHIIWRKGKGETERCALTSIDPGIVQQKRTWNTVWHWNPRPHRPAPTSPYFAHCAQIHMNLPSGATTCNIISAVSIQTSRTAAEETHTPLGAFGFRSCRNEK